MLSRRRFLGATAVGVAAVALRARRAESESTAGRPLPSAALLDLDDECALDESRAGYAAAGLEVVRSTVPRRRLVVVPAALTIAPMLADELLRRASAGATVLVESGGGFATDDALRAHRATMRRSFNVDVEAPVALWPRRRGGIPYVEYRWPAAAQVRDYSRVLPVDPRQGDEIIARVGDLPVALRRGVGRGALVVLGSPLGPALHAGDGEAWRVLRAFPR